jgi:hypothetical protein
MPRVIGRFNVRIDGDPPRGPVGFQQEYHAVPSNRIPMLRSGIEAVERAYRSDSGACDRIFRRIGHGVTLGELLERRGLWISYSPHTDFVGYAEAPDIVLSERAYRHGVDTLGSVLVHELAHIGGVGGDFGTGDRFDHAFADHAAKTCTGTLHPVSMIVRSMESMLEACSNCEPGGRRLGGSGVRLAR